MNDIRVRFAPSPTGGLHIGGVRTALFNYLFAKKHNGKFIVRIEDTDQKRFVEGAEKYILDALDWLGIRPDESPLKGGPFKPYRQSERKEIYHQYAQHLLDQDLAYYAFDTPDELEEMRERLKESGMVNLHYNAVSRMTMTNSLTLPPEVVNRRIENGDPYVIRLKVPPKEEIRFKDEVRGFVVVHSSTLDDKVILKSDGLPTYHLANVVDDYLMKISHVIRGEEWLPSAPLHILLYRFLGWEKEMPAFAHLPLILKPDGNGKLSKRAADKAGFPIFPLSWTDPATNADSEGFKEKGYLPEALINFLALLGWNPGTDQELFGLDELISHFSIQKVGKSGTKFDIEKAQWFNQQYLNQMSDDVLGSWLKQMLKKHHQIESEQKTTSLIASLLKTRVTFQNEILNECLIFFAPPKSYDEKVVRKKYNAEANKALTMFADHLNQKKMSGDEIKNIFMSTLQRAEINPGKYMQVLRVALTGVGGGPDIGAIMGILGVEEIKKRIKTALDTFDTLKSKTQDV
jgi:glutamyl-tRNA synthetase